MIDSQEIGIGCKLLYQFIFHNYDNIPEGVFL